jgi:hypothetical protein
VILTIEIVRAEGNPLANEVLHQTVRGALKEIPAVAVGLTGEQLQVTVKSSGSLHPVSKGTAKREIIDFRSLASQGKS